MEKNTARLRRAKTTRAHIRKLGVARLSVLRSGQLGWSEAEVVGRVVQVTGWELVEQAWREGRGILFLTPHLGCFEITAQYFSTHDGAHGV